MASSKSSSAARVREALTSGPTAKEKTVADGVLTITPDTQEVLDFRARSALDEAEQASAYLDDEDDGPKPHELYGKFTWKIENFSEISKRELRSTVFDVGNYKWYILVYPQGCDVCNHLSLFLCVADYDKLLPGWSHFAQFTIAVVNKDPKKSKYSDTLHRFCKKEHDWGWKKFMELSKVLDGFTVADTLVIKAQVQVILDKPSKPFRCLDPQYRRELVRVYLTNVEGICRRFCEEKRTRLAWAKEEAAKFREWWLSLTSEQQRRLVTEKGDAILKGVVKQFFNEKEVTSTLVMDALYSGCKQIEQHGINWSGGAQLVDDAPIVMVKGDRHSTPMALCGDVIGISDRACRGDFISTPKDHEMRAQVMPNDGLTLRSEGDDYRRDSIERDEKRLAELGRRTVEMYVIAHVFNDRLEVAYRESEALKRQDKLIAEEFETAQIEQVKAQARAVADKEKKAKKKERLKAKKEVDRQKKEAEEADVRAVEDARRSDAGKRAADVQRSRQAECSAASTQQQEKDQPLSTAAEGGSQVAEVASHQQQQQQQQQQAIARAVTAVPGAAMAMASIHGAPSASAAPQRHKCVQASLSCAPPPTSAPVATPSGRSAEVKAPLPNSSHKNAFGNGSSGGFGGSRKIPAPAPILPVSSLSSAGSGSCSATASSSSQSHYGGNHKGKAGSGPPLSQVQRQASSKATVGVAAAGSTTSTIAAAKAAAATSTRTSDPERIVAADPAVSSITVAPTLVAHVLSGTALGGVSGSDSGCSSSSSRTRAEALDHGSDSGSSKAGRASSTPKVNGACSSSTSESESEDERAALQEEVSQLRASVVLLGKQLAERDAEVLSLRQQLVDANALAAAATASAAAAVAAVSSAPVPPAESGLLRDSSSSGSASYMAAPASAAAGVTSGGAKGGRNTPPLSSDGGRSAHSGHGGVSAASISGNGSRHASSSALLDLSPSDSGTSALHAAHSNPVISVTPSAATSNGGVSPAGSLFSPLEGQEHASAKPALEQLPNGLGSSSGVRDATIGGTSGAAAASTSSSGSASSMSGGGVRRMHGSTSTMSPSAAAFEPLSLSHANAHRQGSGGQTAGGRLTLSHHSGNGGQNGSTLPPPPPPPPPAASTLPGRQTHSPPQQHTPAGGSGSGSMSHVGGNSCERVQQHPSLHHGSAGESMSRSGSVPVGSSSYQEAAGRMNGYGGSGHQHMNGRGSHRPNHHSHHNSHGGNHISIHEGNGGHAVHKPQQGQSQGHPQQPYSGSGAGGGGGSGSSSNGPLPCTTVEKQQIGSGPTTASHDSQPSYRNAAAGMLSSHPSGSSGNGVSTSGGVANNVHAMAAMGAATTSSQPPSSAVASKHGSKHGSSGSGEELGSSGATATLLGRSPGQAMAPDGCSSSVQQSQQAQTFNGASAASTRLGMMQQQSQSPPPQSTQQQQSTPAAQATQQQGGLPFGAASVKLRQSTTAAQHVDSPGLDDFAHMGLIDELLTE